MKLFRSGDAAFERADERNFVGSARVMKMPMVADATQPVTVYLVEFEPGGRTNWHRHSGPSVAARERGARIRPEMGRASARHLRG